MKRFMKMAAMAVFAFSFGRAIGAGGGIGQTEEELARLKYERAMYDEVVWVNVWAEKIDWPDDGWKTSASFKYDQETDEAMVSLSLGPGPGRYEVRMNLTDSLDHLLFYVDTKVVEIELGDNPLVFFFWPVEYREFVFAIDGAGPEDDVFVNGQRAWLSSGFWRASVRYPWLVDELEIAWVGRGVYVHPAGPEYEYSAVLILPETNFADPGAAETTADIVFFSMRTSYPSLFWMQVDSWGEHRVFCSISPYPGNEQEYPEEEIFVVLSRYDQWEEQWVEYWRGKVSPKGRTFTIDLGNKKVYDLTQVQFLFVEPEGDGEAVRKINDRTIYYFNWQFYADDGNGKG